MLFVILVSMLIIVSALSVIRDLVWQQTRVASERESDTWDTVDWDRKWLVDFIFEKTQLISFHPCNNIGAIDVIMDSSVFEEKSPFKMLGWISFLIWSGALTLSLLLKLSPRKLEPWFVLWSFFFMRLLCFSPNLPYAHAWNTDVRSGLVPLFATWNC